MAEMLLLNPRKRARRAAAKKARKSRRRRNPIRAVAAPRRRTRTISAVARRVRRRRNPIALRSVSRMGRRVRRRRNPISLGGGGSMVSALVRMVKEAAIGGAGAVAVDAAMGQINRFLPASLQRTPGRVGVGDAVKAVITVALARLLNRPTRGLSMKMGQGALTVQAHQIIAGFVPASIQLGYASPAFVAAGTNRVGPIRKGMNAYVPAGAPSPLLNRVNAYTRAGGPSPLLSSARTREGAIR